MISALSRRDAFEFGVIVGSDSGLRSLVFGAPAVWHARQREFVVSKFPPGMKECNIEDGESNIWRRCMLTEFLAQGATALNLMLSVFLYPFSQIPFTDPQFENKHVLVGEGIDRMTLPVGVHDAGSDAPTVLFFMGNGGTRQAFVRMMQPYIDANMSVVIMPYRGGEGIGSYPSESLLKADALVTFDALDEILGHSSPSVHVHGFSLGTGIALNIAAVRDVDSVILVSPYAKICEVVEKSALIPVCAIDGLDKWESIKLAPLVDEPVFIAHGMKDTTIHVSHGKRLAVALSDAGAPVLLHFYSKAHHNDIDVTSGVSSDVVAWINGGYSDLRKRNSR